MGDFYGVYKENNELDTRASYEQLMNAPKGELLELLDYMDAQAAHSKDTPNTAQLETITKTYRQDGQLSYLELAQHNDCHFSAASMDGTSNNMGTYLDFHRQALELAASLEFDTARGMEASGTHFLTDRFSHGHAFDKQAVEAATGQKKDSDMANLGVKELHDAGNEFGGPVENEQGDTWKAFGDNHWKEDENQENQLMIARAVAASYKELEDVISGKRSPEEIESDGYAAVKLVPKWDEEINRNAQKVESAMPLLNEVQTPLQYLQQGRDLLTESVVGSIHHREPMAIPEEAPIDQSLWQPEDCQQGPDGCIPSTPLKIPALME
jgi:hypothetical protein